MSINDIFDKYEDEYLKFEDVENKRSIRPDVHAFILLTELFPRDRDLICAAEHDEFFLDVLSEEIETLTESQVRELNRCGVRYDSETDSLAMFA